MDRARFAILALVFADLVGFGMLIPDIQLRAERLGARGWTIGAVLSAMFVVQAIASPFWGALSDRVGRKPVVLACTGFSALSMLVYTQADSVGVMLATRILSGLGAANVSIAQAALADASPPARRTALMGQVGAAVSAGLIVGPALGGLLSARGGAPLLGAVAATFSGLGLLAVALFVPASTPKARSKEETAERFSLLSAKQTLRVLFGVAVVGWFALACLEGTFGRLIERNLGGGVFAFGAIFGYESLLSVGVQSLLVARLQARLGDRRLLLVAFALQGLGLAAMPFARSFGPLLVAATVFAIGNALVNPSINGWCSRETPESRQGALFGLLQSARSLGFMVGPTLGGALFDARPWAPYLLAGGASLAAVVIVATMTRELE